MNFLRDALLGWRKAVVLVGLGFSLTASAQMQMPAVARQHYVNGVGLYKLGRYDAAGREFGAAYQLYPSSRLLYDLAQTERQQGQLQQALSHYEQFLWNESALTPATRGAVHGFLARIKTTLAQPSKPLGAPPVAMPDLLDPALGPSPKPGVGLAAAQNSPAAPPAAPVSPGPASAAPGNSRWEIQSVKPDFNLRQVYVQGDAVFAVGDSGIFFVSISQGPFRPVRSGVENWLASVWGTDSELFMTGDSGVLLRRFGGHLKNVPSGTTRTLFAVGGLNSDWFAVGDAGTAVRFNGSVFAPVKTNTKNPLFSVFGIDGEVFAVGAQGTILQYQSGAFFPMPSGTTSWLHSIWGTSRNDLFSVGAHGTILHFDGRSWQVQPSGTLQTLLAVVGTASNDIFAVGSGGTILHYDGVAWHPTPSGTGANLFGVSASPGKVYAVGDAGTILHYLRL